MKDLEKKMQYCKRCLMPDTRPRIVFREDGVCNACHWAEEKKSLDWNKRWRELEALCDKYRNRNKDKFDVIVPYSGGKDGAYIAWMLREKLGMTPLVVTVRPPMEDPIGEQNIKNFIERGFDHIMITPNKKVGAYIDKENFINKGIPMHAHMIAVQTVIFRCAVLYDIPFVMFAEEGETEYGGSTKLKNKSTYELEDSINIYLSGVDPKKYLDKFTQKELYWYTHPSKNELLDLKAEISHWSYFEDFDNYKHYLVAKDECGLLERETRSVGSYENFSTTDTDIIWLYFYLMYLKFGFGRSTNIAGTDIRRGAITREQALNLVKKYDGEFPTEFIDKYLKYYDMTREEFDAVLDKWANKELFEKVDGYWKPIFNVY
ncbi:MAG: N-acetyl sugar amidotransferase [Aliarcobacter butzleri]|nr:N-acetyl sugar amidotransferase [Aliarcobacter butzleri]